MRATAVLLLIYLMAGCAALPERWRLNTSEQGPGPLYTQAEQLLDQPLIDPLTRFLQQHAARHEDDADYQRIARERDSRCRAIGTRYSRRAPTADNLQTLRGGYQYSCPQQVEAFARRVPSHDAPPIPAPAPAREPTPTPAPSLPAPARDCYLLFSIRNDQQAMPACSAAAEAGDSRSQHHLASLLRSQRAFSEALHWAEQSAASGHPAGQLLLAELYQQGQGAPADADRALQLMEKAAGQGLAAAQYQAGMAWLHGVGTEPDRAVALRWLERAAGQDNLAAQLQLAELYFSEPGPARDGARQWLNRAAQMGSATAQYRLGMSYLQGTGGPADPLEAYVWLSLALLNGEHQAQPGIEQLASRLTPGQLDMARQRINAAIHGHPY